MRLHKDLTPAHWFSFSLDRQLANVGTDVSRAIRWKAENNKENSRAAFERSLELLCLSISDPKYTPSTLKELCRLKELLTDYFIFDNQYKSDDTFFERYFYYFSYRAAAERGL